MNAATLIHDNYIPCHLAQLTMAPVTNCIPDHPQLISSLYITITSYTPSILFHTISTPDIPACPTYDPSHYLTLLLPMAHYTYHSDPRNIQNTTESQMKTLKVW